VGWVGGQTLCSGGCALKPAYELFGAAEVECSCNWAPSNSPWSYDDFFFVADVEDQDECIAAAKQECPEGSHVVSEYDDYWGYYTCYCVFNTTDVLGETSGLRRDHDTYDSCELATADCQSTEDFICTRDASDNLCFGPYGYLSLFEDLYSYNISDVLDVSKMSKPATAGRGGGGMPGLLPAWPRPACEIPLIDMVR